MTFPDIPAPPSTDDKPDSATSKHPGYVSGQGPGQVFHFECKWFKYGTDDKVHAAALILSFALLMVIFLIVIDGIWIESQIVLRKDEAEEIIWIPDILKMLGSAFLITAGIAVGKSSG